MRFFKGESIRRVLLALFALSLTVSISAALILSGVLFLEWAFRRFERTHGAPLDRPLGIALAAFMFWMILSTVLSSMANVSSALSEQSAVLFFFVAALGWTRRDIFWFAGWFGFGCVVSGLWGLLQGVSGVTSFPRDSNLYVPGFYAGWPGWAVEALCARDWRAIGSRSHPLTYAETIAPGFFVALAFALKNGTERKFRQAALWGVGLGLIGAGLVFAQGRAIWLGVAAGSAVFVFFQRRNRALFIAAVLTGVVVGAAVMATPRLRGRLTSIVSGSGGTASDQFSKSTRFVLWREAAKVIKANPVAGVGSDGVALVAWDVVTEKKIVWSETHNIYLQEMAEGGVVGFLLFISVLVFLGVSIAKCEPAIRSILAAIFVTFLVAGLTESWINDKEISMIFWVFAGTAEGLRRLKDRV